MTLRVEGGGDATWSQLICFITSCVLQNGYFFKPSTHTHPDIKFLAVKRNERSQKIVLLKGGGGGATMAKIAT